MVGNVRRGRLMTGWMGGATGGSFALLALAVLVIPASATVPPPQGPATHQIVAPYRGATASPSTSASAEGCTTMRTVPAPFFHPRTGDAGFGASVSGRHCPHDPFNEVSVYESVAVAVPVRVNSSAMYVNVTWTIHAAWTSFLSGTCALAGTWNSECVFGTSVSLTGIAELYDATNGTFTRGGTSFVPLNFVEDVYDFCYHGNCSLNQSLGARHGSFNATATWHIHASGLVPAHHYELLTTLLGSVGFSDAIPVYHATTSGVRGSGSLNLATLGNGATLTRITVA